MAPTESVTIVTTGRRACASIQSANSRPTMTTGIVPMATSRISRASGASVNSRGSASAMASRSSRK